MRHSKYIGAACALSISYFASAAFAAEPADGAASPPVQGAATETSSNHGSVDDAFWRRYRPLPFALELGVYGGAAHFADEHNLQDLNIVARSRLGHEELQTALDLGFRAAFYPLSFVGVEGELGVIASKTRPDGESAAVYTYRAHLIVQCPGFRLAPFALIGVGGMSLQSHADSIGDDSDPEWHLGGGLKFAFSEHVNARIDVRDNLMQKNRLLPGVSNGNLVSNTEFLLGVGFTLGRTPWQPAAAPVDSDSDGFLDPQDVCPHEPGVAPNGCPPPVVLDTDKDGIPDATDACPLEPEDGAPPNPSDGCPNKDVDGDGILVPEDKCPMEKGILPDGCPVRDADRDGIPDAQDKCPEQPETVNGFQDADGCPDELPQAVAKFAGVIKGIEFDVGKATIRKSSSALLDEAAKVLTEYQDIHILISGYTDDVGQRQKNIELSEARASSVKAFLVARGIDAARIETHGAGPDGAIADNKTDKGRQQNRRIEFKLVTQ